MPGRTKIGGAMLVIAGVSLHVAERSVSWFSIPAAVLVGVGALFTMFGPID